jgi:type I restriction enzyme M protein
MLDQETKRRIDSARDILVGKIPDPKAQVEQITTAMIYKFMDDMDKESEEMGGKTRFFADEFKKYSWSKLMDSKLSGEERLNLYVEAISNIPKNSKIPQLFRNIFKDTFLPFRDPKTLSLFLKEINDFNYDHTENLGNAFEYLLSVLGSQGDAGQFRTPRHIIDFIVEAVGPKKNDKILDPACGTAGFLISAYKHILKTNSSNFKPEKEEVEDKIKQGETARETVIEEKVTYKGDLLTPDERKKIMNNIVGYEISPDMAKLSLVNMYLHGFKDPKIYEYDTLSSEDRWDDDFDVILANPPFMTPKGGIIPHKRFSVQAKRSEVLFVDYIAEHLTINGKAGIIVPEGIIFQSSNAYKSLRKNLIENWGLYAVVSLPSGVFQPYSGVKTSILFLDRELAKKTDEILFVKIENDGFDLGAQRRKIDKNDLPDGLKALKKWKKEQKVEEGNRVAFSVKKERISENGEYHLTGERYRESERGLFIKGKWEMVELGEVCEIKRGKTITKKDLIDGDVPVIAGGQQPAYYHNQSNRIGKTITVSGSGAYAGFINYFEKPIFASDCSTIQSINEKKALTNFIFYVLKGQQEEIYKLQSGMGQPHVYAKDLQTIKIPLPPLEIQEQIVEEIEQYQKIIDGAKQVVDNWKPNFKIEPDWKMVTLGEVFQIESGGTPDSKKPDYWDGDIKWATLVDIPKDIQIISETKRKITTKGLKASSAKLLPEKTVLVSSRATIGRIAVINSEMATNQGFKNIIIDKNNHPLFVAYMLSRQKEKMIQLASGGTFKEISKTAISTIQIPLPPLKVQKQIVEEIESEKKIVDSNKKLIEKMIKKIEAKLEEVWGD